MPIFPRSRSGPRLIRLRHFFSLAPLIAVTAACSLESISQSDGSVGYVQLVNAAPRYAGVDLYLNSDLVLPSQSYGLSPIYANVPVSATPKTFSALISNDTTLIANAQSTIGFHTVYTVVVTQRTVKGGLLVLPDTVSAPAAGQAALRLVNVAPSVPVPGTVDVYLTSPSVTDLTSETPVASNIAFEASSLYIPFSPGTVRIRVTAAGTKTPFLLDINPLTLTTGQVGTILLLDNASGGSPFQRVIITDRS